jgi:hypothetical protein
MQKIYIYFKTKVLLVTVKENIVLYKYEFDS